MDREIERKSARAGQLACAAIAAWLITPPLVVCASQERAAEVAPVIEMDSLAGRWNTAAGKTWEFQRRGVATYNARSVLPSTPQEYRATVREIGGAKFLEVSFLAPCNSAGVPVFLYTTVEVAGDTMTLRRVRAEWLEREVRGDWATGVCLHRQHRARHERAGCSEPAGAGGVAGARGGERGSAGGGRG